MATAIVGASGEHYVAAFLSGQGLIVALPRAGVKGSDLLVADEDGNPLRIQVKTARDARGIDKVGEFFSWDTSYSVLKRPDPFTWFAYVSLNQWPMKPNLPEVFFVPSTIVCAHIEMQQATKSKRPFFWMYVDSARPYNGLNGFELMKNAMRPTNAPESH